ncbi:MAG: hypothetical protein EAZ97_13205 [Bacteroidetes bacterium]|nr:MAG: hypothetical protein EAZ97_13205 [Bacteroidota bacterium]
MKALSQQKIFAYIAEGNYAKARKLLKNQYKKEAESYWLMTMIGSTYYEEKNYSKALFWAEKAMIEGKNDPLVLWDYAGVLAMENQLEKAMEIWLQLLAWGTKKVGLELCSEGILWAKSLLNDCRFRLAMAYKEQKNLPLATEYLQAHLANRRGTPSIYPLKEVKKEWKLLGN